MAARQMPRLACARLARVARHVLPAGGPQPPQMSPCPVHALAPGATVAVTGAAGFVGGWLTRLLLERGYSVRACVRDVADDRKVGFLKAMPEYGGRLSLYSADMTVAGSYDAIFEGCSTVFHPAEVFMSFGFGRDVKQAKAEFGKSFGASPFEKGGMHQAALASSQNIVDSINKSTTVSRLIYTASVASMGGGPVGGHWRLSRAIDETHLPQPDGLQGYGGTKRLTEKFFDFHAQASGGKWDTITGNPGDIAGPILSLHQARETWQGKIAGVLEGTPAPQELAGRPWFLVDVRDVAMCEIFLAESKMVESGARFLLASADKLPPEHIGMRAMELHPKWDCATTLAPGPGAKKVAKTATVWYRSHLDNSKVRAAIGIEFRSFSDTFKATIDSLVEVGGIKPKLK